MSKTKIRSNQQIQDISIVDAQISASASISTSKLAEGVDFLKRDGSVALNNILNANNFSIENLGTPLLSNDIARKIDIENALLGLNVKKAVRVATTVSIDLDEDLEEGKSIDGITLVEGDRVLVKDQSNASQNGIYVVPASGSASRADDADESEKFPLNSFVFVSEGSSQEDTGWVTTNDGSFVLDTDDLIFSKFFDIQIVNSASNIGLGVGVFKQLNVDDLEFYSINTSNNRLSIALDTGNNVVEFTINESNIDHNSLLNYNVDQHRTINDSATGATDLWSASKISSELNLKFEKEGYLENEIIVADSNGDLQNVELSGDATINSSGVIKLSEDVIKLDDIVINEEPSGDVDGVNTDFSLAHRPVPNSLRFFVNGVLKSEGASEDYIKAYKFITLNDPPETGDRLRASYIKAKQINFASWDSQDAFNYNLFVSAFQSREAEVNSQKNITYVGSISIGSLRMRSAVIAPNGNIYGPNFSGGSMIKLDTTTDTITTFGSLPTNTTYYSCVLAQNGMIYIIAANGQCYKIDPINETITSLGNHNSGTFYFAVLAPNGCIYSSPYDSTQMFKIDTSDDSIHNFSGAFTGGYSYGIGIGSDGNVYCAPHRNTNIIRINTSNDTTTLINSSTSPDFRYQGRVVLDTHGQLYFTQGSATNGMLKLNINTQTPSTFSAPGPAGFTPTRYVGGILSPYGSIFHAPATEPFLIETIPPSGNSQNVSGSPNFGTTTWKYGNPIISPQGNLYLLNYINSTNWQKFSLGGLSNYPLDFYLSPFVNHC